MRLLLIRHGQTPSNVVGAIDTGFPGAPLTPLGHRQAEAVPAALADLDIAAVHASTLIRTQLTAGPLAEARGLPVQVHEGVREIQAGTLEMREDTEAVHAYADCLVGWMHGDLGRTMPGASDGHDFLARYDAAVRAIAEEHPDGTVAVFSHGAAIRVWTAWSTGMEPGAAVELSIMNTGMAVLDGDPVTGWRLVRWSKDPVGGAALVDEGAHDVTGESAEEETHTG